MAVHVIDEANRCLNCGKPMCQDGCPIHTPIPKMIQAFKEGKINEAGEMLFENNPMSVICSLVCDHRKQCVGHCVRGKKGEPVQVFADSTIISISQGLKSKMVNTTEGLKSSANGLLMTNIFGETTHPGISAAGDVVLGARTVVEAAAYSKIVADAMDKYIQGA